MILAAGADKTRISDIISGIRCADGGIQQNWNWSGLLGTGLKSHGQVLCYATFQQ